MDVTVHNVSYTVNEREILHHINGTFYKGRVTIFMGPSGAGKTTIMDLMAGRRNVGIMCGNITFNGMSRSHCCIGYCQSYDLHIGELSVYQNLYYSCQLRSSISLTSQEIYDKCFYVANIVGLHTAFDTMVGNILIKGISGGQQKLLSIATELLGNPDVFFLDEPTTGLDSVTSLAVTKILHDLAVLYQKTIISTIHQPSEDMIEMFHHLFLLSDGNVVYSGDIPHLSRYLSYIRLAPNVPRSNVIEYSLELLGESTQREYLIKSWKQQLFSEWSTPHPTLAVTEFPPPVPASPFNVTKTLAALPVHQKYWICLQRHFLYKVLSPHGLVFVLVNNLLAGVFYGVIYLQNGDSLQEANILLEPDNNTIVFNYYAYNLISLQFSTLLYVLLSQSLHISSSYHMKSYYDHEIKSGYVSPFMVYLIFLSVDLPMILISLYFYTIIVLNLVNPFGEEKIYYSLLLITGIIGFAIAQLMIIISSSPLDAFLSFALISSLEIIFSGYFITKDELPSILKWTVECSNIYHAMGSMMYNEFHNLMGKQGDIVLYIYGYDTFRLVETYHVLGYYILILVTLIIIAIAIVYSFNFVDTISCEEYEIIHEKLVKKFIENHYAERESSFQLSIGTGMSSSRNTAKDEELEERKTNIEIPSIKEPPNHTLNPLQTILIPNAPAHNDQNGAKLPHHRSSIASLRSSYSLKYNPRMISFNEILKPHYNRPSFTSSSSHNIAAVISVQRPVNLSSLPTDPLPIEKQVTLQFQSLSYTVSNFDGTSAKLLKNINGIVRPGELCAIIGPTGSGKTTLLNVLAGRATVGKIEGHITVNRKVFKGIQKENRVPDPQAPRFGYVMQDDAHTPILTVKETLQFAAMLRMRVTSPSKVEKNVEEILTLLGIESIAGSYIGSDERRTISRGQLRRVTIGCEIIDSSSLIFLDEPTSGLDSYLAATIVDTLTVLAATGRTLLCTIHQPSYSIFTKFHTLLLLSNGRLVYSGLVSHSAKHFEELGYPPAGDLNPAEYVVTLLSKLPMTGSQSIESLASEIEKHCPESIQIESTSFSPTLSCFSVSAITHTLSTTYILIHILLRREILKESRRFYFWCIFYLRSLFVGFAIGGVWYNISCEGFAIVERLGLFLTVYLLTSLWLTEFIPTFHLEKIIFYRERESNAVTTFTSWFIFGLLHLLLLYIAIILLTLPIYYLADLNDETQYYHYFIFSLTVYLGSITNLYLNHILVYFTPNHMIHILIFPGVSLAVQSLLSGYAVLPSTISLAIRWVIYINPCFLVMDSLFVNEFKHNSCADSFQNSFQYYEEGFSYTIPQQKVLCYLLIMICANRVIGYLTMRWVNSIRA